MGRITASYRFISFGGIPLGALLGGMAGDWLGLRGGLILGSVGLLSAAAFVLVAPLRDVRELPGASDA